MESHSRQPHTDLSRQKCKSLSNIPLSLLDARHQLKFHSFQLKFAELHDASVRLVSFCTIAGREKLFAVASEAVLLIYRLQLGSLETIKADLPRELVCRFDFDPGHLLTTLAWSPATQLQAEVELLVASSDGTVSLCRWAGNSRKRGWSTSIKHLAKHQGGAVSLHVSPKREIARAVSTGADNSLNLYDTQRLWQVSEKRWLRSAGKFVSFADKEIVLYELDGTLRMYDAFSARPLRVSLYTKRFPLRVACTDNRLATVTLNGALLVFDAPFWHPPVLACEAGHNEEGKFTSCLCMAISPTKRWVALGDAGGYYIQHVHTGEIVQSFSTPHPVLHLSWHSKMTMLAIANGTKVQLTYLK